VHLSYRGSVNSWECDENDHLNVRFYVEKHCQTLCGGASALGLFVSAQAQDVLGSVTVQHIRFLQESRLAAPLSGYVGVIAVNAEFTDVLTELRQSYTGEVLCTCIHRLAGVGGKVSATLEDYAAPKGVEDSDLRHTVLDLAAVPGYGFHPIGMGVMQVGECDVQGVPLLHNYMGRISDSMPHLWGDLHGETGMMDENEGGAILEYRLRYHRPLHLGRHFTLMSGVSAVGAKVQGFAHLMFETVTGDLCVSAEAAGVRLDLTERRAMVLSEEMQAGMRTRMIKDMHE